MKTKINILGKIVEVDDVYSQFFDGVESLGSLGRDVAIYTFDGVSMWPCGDVKKQWCECKICKQIRKILAAK